VDVVFAPSPIETDETVRVEPLWSEPRVLVVPVTHALAGRESISIVETADEVFLGASGGASAILDWWLVDPRPDGSHPKRGPVADDIEPATILMCSLMKPTNPAVRVFEAIAEELAPPLRRP
jgi:DNA-binding transcriptional LysR family regulator